MKVFLIAFMLMLCSCQSQFDWENHFYQKGQEALLAGSDFDVFFYNKDLMHSSDKYRQLAMMAIPRNKVSNSWDHSNYSDEETLSVFNKLRYSFIPAYVYSGSLDAHVTRLKKISKELDPESRGVNIILRVADYTTETEAFADDGFGDDGFGDDELALQNVRYDTSIIMMDTSIIDIIKVICEKEDLRYKVTEHAVIIADKSGCGCGDEVRFYNISSLDNFHQFKQYLDLLDPITEGSWRQRSYIESVNRFVVKDTVEKHEYIESFVIPNFEEVMQLDFYDVKVGVSIPRKRAELEKNPQLYKLRNQERLAVINQRPRLWRDFRFSYGVRNQSQLMTIEYKDKTFEYEYLGACDQLIPLDDSQVLLLKIR
jgi:hypothetical protein